MCACAGGVCVHGNEWGAGAGLGQADDWWLWDALLPAWLSGWLLCDAMHWRRPLSSNAYKYRERCMVSLCSLCGDLTSHTYTLEPI